MHHTIPKLLGTHVLHKVACRTPDPSLYLKCQGQRSKGDTMHHRIPKLIGTHIHHDEVMMAEVKTNLPKKETALFSPFPTCRRIIT